MIPAKIQKQYDQFMKRGGMFVMEYPIIGDDWLLVNLELDENGIIFHFDQDPISPYGNPKPTHFDGEITGRSGVYCLPFECSLHSGDSLDEMLEIIDDNMTEGFLLPNDLYRLED